MQTSHTSFWLHNNLCELTTLENIWIGWFGTQKPDLIQLISIKG